MTIKKSILVLCFCFGAILVMAQQPAPQPQMDEMMQQLEQQMKQLMEQMSIDTTTFPGLGFQNFGNGGVIIIDGDTVQTFGNMPNFFNDPDFQQQQEEWLKQLPKHAPDDNAMPDIQQGLEQMMKQLQEMMPTIPMPDVPNQPNSPNKSKKKRKIIKI